MRETKSTEIITVPPEQRIVAELGVADETIADLPSRYTGLTAETPQKYEQVRLAIADVRKVRVGVEHSRKALKADVIAFGKKVDAEAKRITAALEVIEKPLKEAKQKADDHKAELLRQKEEEERQRIEAELEAKRQAEETERQRIAAEEKAERDRIAAEQVAERERLEAEKRELEEQRKALEAEQEAARLAREAEERATREELEAERQKMAEERRQLEEEKAAERARKEQEEAERQAKIRAEQEAKEAAERAEREAEEARRRAEAERKRLETLRPDAEKLRGVVASLRTFAIPAMSTDEGADLAAFARERIGRAADAIEGELPSEATP